jgi:SWI/SNF-related matrix-associated actin-dependent regulator of chromatin subfamily D
VLFQQLPEIVNRFLLPPDPIVLHYMINPGAVPPDRPSAWDVEVKLDDLSLKSRMKGATLEANPTTVKTLAELDDEVGPITKYDLRNPALI